MINQQSKTIDSQESRFQCATGSRIFTGTGTGPDLDHFGRNRTGTVPEPDCKHGRTLVVSKGESRDQHVFTKRQISEL